MAADALTGETTELLQTLIRNRCVNDGSPDSGFESRNADALQTFLEGAGLDVARYEARPGRASVVARIEGSDPSAPSLCLMGHTDVVPVSPEGWSHDPFGGELIDGEVWGRGAIDMLNLTSSMAVAFRHLARIGLPAARRPHLLRRRRRGGRRGVGCGVDVRAPSRRDRRRLLRDRARRLVDRRRARPAPRHGQRRREGHGVAQAPRHRHAGPRLDAVRRRQRARQGGRDREPPCRVPAGAADQRHLPAAGRHHEHAGGAARGAGRPRPDRRRAGDAARADRPLVPRPHAHDAVAQRRPQSARRRT